jgi:hypothetical protein
MVPLRNIVLFMSPTALLALYGCGDARLEKHDDGWISYARAPAGGTGASVTRGRFVREDGCIVFRSGEGRRYLLLMPEGQRLSVEPERVLFSDEWAALGLDASSPAAQSLRADPVAAGCGATPAFVTDIGPSSPPPPPPAGDRPGA